MPALPHNIETDGPRQKADPATHTPFVNAMRLPARHWLAVAAVTAIILTTMPWLWQRIERFDITPDYRIAYSLSRDYWLYQRAVKAIPATDIPIIGDSVIWGEYVRRDGTLSHFLNVHSDSGPHFVNGGVNGLFPLALEGLVRHYGTALHGRKVILHCNLLWMSSPKADLRTDKEERFNHADLVPQFSPRIPCYKASLNRRMAATVENHFPFSQWATHLQVAYFGQKNILTWTLEEDAGSPPRLPNAWKNPIKQITLRPPEEPEPDPDRGPGTPRHRPWSSTGQGTTRFEWVALEQSLQWAAFQRIILLLRSRGNDVLVVIGPFNEQLMAEANRPLFRRLRDSAAAWLTANNVAHVVPEPLPSALYADASHPLTEGYERLARTLLNDRRFSQWCAENPRAETRNPKEIRSPKSVGRTNTD